MLRDFDALGNNTIFAFIKIYIIRFANING